MHQKRDLNFIGILSKIRTRDAEEDVEEVLRLRFISNKNQTIPPEAAHIYHCTKTEVFH